jgi:uncharacterized protein
MRPADEMQLESSAMNRSALLVAATVFAFATHSANAQQTYSLGSTKQGSLSYAVSATVAKLMNEELGLLARVQPKGGAANNAALQSGDMAFNVINAAESRMAHYGKDVYEGRPHDNLMIAAMVFPLRVSIAVPNDSPIKSLKEVKGLKMGYKFTNNAIIQFVQSAILANAGLKQSDMKNHPYPNYIPAGDDMARGRLDVALVTPGTGASKQQHAMLKSRGGLRFLPLDTSPEALARQREVYPESFIITLQPSPAIPGVVGPTPVLAYPHFLTVGKHVPADIVYKVVKMMHGSKEKLVQGFVQFQQFDPSNMAPKTSVPYHPGALKFYKEAGIRVGGG